MSSETEAPAPPPVAITGGTRWARAVARYRRLFAVEEIAGSVVLQRFFLVCLLGFLITLTEWIDAPWLTVEAVDANRFRCWPHLQSCGDWAVLSDRPFGFSQPILYAVLFGVLLGAVVAAVRGRYVLAHALALVLLVWKLLVYFVLSSMFAANYHFFHVVLAAVFLLVPYKTYFLRRSLVVLYFLAASLKIHEGWVLGTYFTSMNLGLPLVPDLLAPFAANAVILLETVGAPLLLWSSRPRLARAVFWAFVGFHVYSIAMVRLSFSITCLLPLIALFGPRLTPIEPPWNRRALAGWAIIGMLFAGQAIALLIPGDSRITGEGSMYGLSMFDANHQCQSDMTVERPYRKPRRLHQENTAARKRCDPYREWFMLRTLCRRSGADARVAWTYDHSINGGPFYRIIDEADACALDYEPFGHNAWIRTPEDGAPVIGYPVKNDFD